MEEQVKEYLLEIIPDKVREFRAKHRECAESHGPFWDTMPERFARQFKEDPEGTLEKFLSLGDEDCAWREGDFMTRNLLLDNFIGRGIAKEIKKELDGMKDIRDVKKEPSVVEDIQSFPEEPEKKKEEGEAVSKVEELLKANLKLKREKDMYLDRLSTCKKEKMEAEQKLRNLERSIEDNGVVKALEEEKKELERKLKLAKSRIEEQEEDYEKLRRYSKAVDKRLKRCLRRRGPMRVRRMAGLVKLGIGIGRFTPSSIALDLGISYHTTHKYLKALRELGIVKRLSWGTYTVEAGLDEDNLEDEIARRMAQHEGKRGGAKDNPEEDR